MNVVPRSTMNTNGGTDRELTLKCKLKCYLKPMKDHLFSTICVYSATRHNIHILPHRSHGHKVEVASKASKK